MILNLTLLSKICAGWAQSSVLSEKCSTPTATLYCLVMKGITVTSTRGKKLSKMFPVMHLVTIHHVLAAEGLSWSINDFLNKVNKFCLWMGLNGKWDIKLSCCLFISVVWGWKSLQLNVWARWVWKQRLSCVWDYGVIITLHNRARRFSWQCHVM